MAKPEDHGEGLSEDALLDGRVRLLQPARGYRVAIDAVLLAAAVPVQPGDRVLDAGTGVGSAALCLLARQPQAWVTGFEIQVEFADLARRNAVLNGAEGRFDVVDGDIEAPPAGLVPASFDHAMANPPFRADGGGTSPPDAGKAVATVEGAGGLATWMTFVLDMTRPGGTVTLIHQAARLGDILAGFAGRAGGIVVCPLWPAADQPAGRIVVTARKGDKSPLTLHPGLILHGPDGGFTEAVQGILRQAKGCALGRGATQRRKARNATRE